MHPAYEAVFEQFPEARPYADLIAADSPAEVAEVASAISQRLRALPQPTVTTTERPNVQSDAVKQAIADRDFSAFLKAKKEEQGLVY